MVYMLFLVLSTSVPAIHSVPFGSMELCEAEKARILAALPQDKHIERPTILCVWANR